MTNPALAILAVRLVPPNCEKVSTQKMTNTPINLINGSVLSSGKLITYDSAPSMK